MATLTAYPVAGATSPVDGETRRASVDETFATIRGGAGTIASATATSAIVQIQASTTTDQYTTLRRVAVCFDTSSIGAAGTVTAAVLSFEASAKDNGTGTVNVHAGQVTLASTADVTTSDYAVANWGGTSFGSIAYADITTAGAYSDITLDANGLANINKTGVSQFALRTQYDINNTAPTWVSEGNSYVQLVTADAGQGASGDPKLVVTYTPGVGKLLALTGVGG